ncbi:MAG: acyl carrier protein [Alphaproteobacteria bacterium]
MTQGLATVLQDIHALLEPYNKEGVELTDATEISADLNVDSVAVMDLLMTIEDKYNISIPINLLTDVRTIGDLARIVRDTIGSGSGNGSL